MLFTLRQLNKGFNKLLISQYGDQGRSYQVGENGGGVPMELGNIIDKEGYIKRNQDLIFAYLNSLSSQKGELLNLKKLASTDRKALNNLLNTIGLKKDVLNVSEIAEKLEEYLKLKGYFNAEAASQFHKLSKEVDPSGKNPGTKVEESKKELDVALQGRVDDINKKTEDDIIRNFDLKKSNKSQIMQLQEILLKRGYKLGIGGKNKNGVDGVFAEKTKDALLNEQELIKPKNSVEFGQSKNASENKETKENQKVIEKGLEDSLLLTYDSFIDKKDKEKTLKLQQVLLTRGYDLGKSGKNKDGIDGLFGNKTKDALNLELALIASKAKVDEANKTQQKEVEKKKENEPKKNQNVEKDQEGSSSSIYRTIEKQPSNIEITAGSGESDYRKLRENINKGSFDTLIKGMSFEQLKAFWEEIVEVSNAHYKKGKDYVYNWGGLGEITKVFEKRGYKPDGAFGGIEVGALVELVEAIYITQLRVHSSKNFTEKVGLLMDYNIDGILDNDVHFYTKEKQFFDAVKTEKELENLLKNMGYANKEALYKALDNNYYSTRREFRDRLGTLLSVETPLNPGAMLKNPDAMKNFTEYKEKLQKGIVDAVETHEKTKNLSPEVKSVLKTNISSIMLMAGNNWGAGITFDTKKLTNEWLDTVGFGIFNGIPGVMIQKAIVDKDRLKLDLGLVNFIPYVSGNVVLSKGDVEKKVGQKLEPLNFSGTPKVDFGFMGSPIAGLAMLNLGVVNEKTKAGIDRSKENFTKVLDNVFKEIKEGKTFENSSYKSNSVDKICYERMAEMYKSLGGNEEAIRLLKEGAANNYETALYENKGEGFKFSGIGVGVLFIVAGFIPFASLNFERTRTKWNEVETYTPKKASSKEGVNVVEKSSTYVTSGLETESTPDIVRSLSAFESKFNFNSRRLKGAKDLMTPENSLETRWNGLNEVASKIKGLPDLLKKVKTDSEKWIVISTVNQYMKKANDFDNGSIKTWNEKLDSNIKKDKARRKGFTTLFGFDANQEADTYYEKLRLEKGKIGKSSLIGIGFDASSSLNVESKSVAKGLDVLYTNLSIITVNGEPLLVPITDKSKVNLFADKLDRLKNVVPSVKEKMVKNLKSGTYNLNFYKDPEGFDDRLLITDKNGNVLNEYGEIAMINVYKPERNTQSLIGAIAGNTNEWDKGSSNNGGGNGNNGGKENPSSTGSGGNNTGNAGNSGGNMIP